ncbi:hypothetical protein RintRC_6779 [Richelia intracellularis]|nr:hypothetical protein RintRC_6779 [Richelia intracellularis]
MQNAIAYSINNWLSENPGAFRILNLLDRSIHHPIISLILLVFAFAIFVTFIKVIIRIIETASLSIMQIPFKLFLGILQLSWISINKAINLAFQNINQPEIQHNLTSSKPSNAITETAKQGRIKEIYQRLAELNKEQEKLLQEVYSLLEK